MIPGMRNICFVLAALHALSQAAAADEDANALARELSNPATSLASLSNKFEWRAYDGDLPGAEDEQGFRYTFQPVLPFLLENGDKIIFRPAFNFPVDEPYFDAQRQSFSSGGGFGDTGFDLAYAPDLDGKVSLGIGIVGGLPTGTNDNLRSGNWTLGPEIFGAYIDDWGLIGGLASHSWKIAGHGNSTNLSSLQYFYFLSLGDGWQVGAGPTLTYDWDAPKGDRLNLPVGMGIAKTTSVLGVPVKFNVEANYSLVRQDTFGPEWLLKFNITPVIPNPFQ